jgi:hypothetical protein
MPVDLSSSAASVHDVSSFQNDFNARLAQAQKPLDTQNMMAAAGRTVRSPAVWQPSTTLNEVFRFINAAHPTVVNYQNKFTRVGAALNKEYTALAKNWHSPAAQNAKSGLDLAVLEIKTSAEQLVNTRNDSRFSTLFETLSRLLDETATQSEARLRELTKS